MANGGGHGVPGETRKRAREEDGADPEAEYEQWRREREREREADRKRQRDREREEEREKIRARERELARELEARGRMLEDNDEPDSKRQRTDEAPESVSPVVPDLDPNDLVAEPSDFVPEEDRVIIKVRKKWSWA